MPGLVTLTSSAAAASGAAPGAYALMLAAAALVTCAGTWIAAARLGLPRARTAAWIAGCVLATLLGARLLDWATAPAAFAGRGGGVSLAALTRIAPSGFALFGGLLAAAVCGSALAGVFGLPLWTLADAAAIPLGVGVALAKTGCQLNGCCFGRECPPATPFAIVPSAGTPAWWSAVSRGTTSLFAASAPAVWPTQSLEIAAGVAAACVGALLLWRAAARGSAFLGAIVTLTAARWAILPLRAVPPTYAAGVTTTLYPALYCAIIAVCAALLFARAWRPARDVAVSTDVLPQMR